MPARTSELILVKVAGGELLLVPRGFATGPPSAIMSDSGPLKDSAANPPKCQGLAFWLVGVRETLCPSLSSLLTSR